MGGIEKLFWRRRNLNVALKLEWWSKGTKDSIPGSSNQDEQWPRDSEDHWTFGDLCTCSSERKYISLGGRKEEEEGGGLWSQGLKKPWRFGFSFVGNEEPWKALEQKSILFNYIIKWWLCSWNGRKTGGKAIQLKAYFRRPSKGNGGFDQGQGQGSERRCAGRSLRGRWSSQEAGASVAAISHVQGQDESPRPTLCFVGAGRQGPCSGRMGQQASALGKLRWHPAFF